jgi:hypothetical protein
MSNFTGNGQSGFTRIPTPALLSEPDQESEASDPEEDSSSSLVQDSEPTQPTRPTQSLQATSQVTPNPTKYGQWTAEEDDLITQQKAAGVTWVEIAEQLPGRSAKGCQSHYLDYLTKTNPNCGKKFWSLEEETRLIDLKRMNRSWAYIANQLPGRTVASCRNHHYEVVQEDKIRKLSTSFQSLGRLDGV